MFWDVIYSDQKESTASIFRVKLYPEDGDSWFLWISNFNQAAWRYKPEGKYRQIYDSYNDAHFGCNIV